jgi:hypothetical protein
MRPHNVRTIKFELRLRSNVGVDSGPPNRKTPYPRKMLSTIVQLTRYSPSFEWHIQESPFMLLRCITSCSRQMSGVRNKMFGAGKRGAV